MSKSEIIPQVQDQVALAALLVSGHVLHEPNHAGVCELTLPLELEIEYECDKALYFQLGAYINASESPEFKHVFLQEPDTCGSWCIVAASNRNALAWEQVAPSKRASESQSTECQKDLAIAFDGPMLKPEPTIQQQRPRLGRSYTLYEVLKVLALPDRPSLGFRFDGYDGVIQYRHITNDELLSVFGIADSAWSYQYTTEECIPVFSYVGGTPVSQFLDLETGSSDSHARAAVWWATPKGFPITKA